MRIISNQIFNFLTFSEMRPLDDIRWEGFKKTPRDGKRDGARCVMCNRVFGNTSTEFFLKHRYLLSSNILPLFL